MLITADHGNAEKMHDDATGQPHTAHTLNRRAVRLRRPAARRWPTGGSLQDIAPTLLAMMGLPQPAEMTGRSLRHASAEPDRACAAAELADAE